ncbi:MULTISPECIES: DNA polymerase [Sorangium]|uniref:DNA polymerase n=1 Tax=Sorangium TaxID=39643 RepID=UPI003D9C296A
MKPRVEDCVFVDFETVTTGDLSLKKMSTFEYLTDRRFDVLCVAIALGRGDVHVYSKGAPSSAGLDQAQAVLRKAADDGQRLVAHNVGFDGLVCKLRCGLDFSGYFDTTGYARFLGIQAGLANTAAFFGKNKLEAPPFTEASLLDPALRQKMMRYCATDVALARFIFSQAVADEQYPAAEFVINSMTAAANLRGLRVDTTQAAAFATELANLRAATLTEFASSFDFDTSDLSKTKKVLAVLEDRWGIKLTSLDKRDPTRADAIAHAPEAQRFLALRQRLQTLRRAVQSASAYAKIPSGRIYNFAHYYGAHTGRFTAGGRDAGKLNIHTLFKTKNSAKIPELGRERTLIVPTEGSSFRAADLSNIEARVVAWVAGEQALLDQFATPGSDVYIWFAQPIFPGVRIVKGGENDHLRQLGKEAVLGLGFGMGFDKFLERVRAAVPGVDAELVQRMFDAYQGLFPRIRGIRYTLHRRFAHAVDQHVASHAGPCPIYLSREPPAAGPTVVVGLPTGRSLFYRSVLAEDELWPRGPQRAFWYAPSATCHPSVRSRARGQGVRRFLDGQIRARVTPQVLIENIVQAIARDLMVHQAMQLEQAGLRVAFHAHDEVVVECSACLCVGAAARRHEDSCPWIAAGKVMKTIMSAVPPTLPGLSGLPVACELKEEVRTTYAG